jgi:pilus assembly protein CpaB
MKKYGTLITLGLAVLFGILAVFLANRWMSSQVTEQSSDREKTAVAMTKAVIATENVEIGVPLAEKHLALADWPRANLPQGAFEQIKDVEGRVSITRLTAGQPILAAELAAPGSGAGLVAMLPEGMRAISIRVDDVSGVSGFILPNTYVDVIHVESKGDKEVASIILEMVRVLAIAQETYTEEGKPKVVKTVTVQLSPEDATKLALKVRQGAIHLALRSPLEETKQEELVAVKKTEAPLPLVRRAAPRAAAKTPPKTVKRVAAPAPEPFTKVEVIRGITRKVEEVPAE